MTVMLISLLLLLPVLALSTMERRFAAAVTGNETSLVVANEDHHYQGFCDETKCFSSADGMDASLYTSDCYGSKNNDTIDPMRCKHGFVPTIIGTEAIREYKNMTLSYYTCCLPLLYDTSLLSSSTNDDEEAEEDFETRLPNDAITLTTTGDFSDVTRHCGDPITVGKNDAMLCGDDDDDDNDNANDINIRQYPYKTMNPNTEDNNQISYMCCDLNHIRNKTITTVIETSIVENLNEKECIYRQHCKVPTNSYGKLYAMKCGYDDYDIKNEGTESFAFPKPTKTNTLNHVVYFQCCREGQNQHFVQDMSFNLTIYPQIVLSCISSLISVVLVVALTIPLWQFLKNKKGSQSTRTKQQQQHHNNQSSNHQTEYSSYNLYLVYLSVPDLALNLFLATKYATYAMGTYDINHFAAPHIIANVTDQNSILVESTIVLACACGNLYINAIVAHEVLVLLKNSFQRKHHTPPSLKKVTIQATSVFVFTIIMSLIHYFVGTKLLSGHDNLAGAIILELFLSLFVVFGIPMAYLTYVCFVIWRKELMPDVEGRLKELAFFFFRIILVFFVFWLPGFSFVLYSHMADYNFKVPHTGMIAAIGLLICGAQPLGSFCMAMTKSDVKKYVTKLLTLSYFRHCCNWSSKPNDSQGQSGIEAEPREEMRT